MRRIRGGHTKHTAGYEVFCRILFEKGIKSKLSGNEVYYTACSLQVLSENSCSKFHCQKVLIVFSFHIRSCASFHCLVGRNPPLSLRYCLPHGLWLVRFRVIQEIALKPAVWMGWSNTYIYTHTHAHTHIYTYIHTYIYIYTDICIYNGDG